MPRTRELVVGLIADYLIARLPGHPLRVAVDGVTAAGKSTFAAELEAAITARNTPAIHLSTDDYHHVRDYRHRNPDPALGYYRDAYDLAAFRAAVLDPLGPQGDGRYRRRLHDLTTDELVDAPRETASRRAS